MELFLNAKKLRIVVLVNFPFWRVLSALSLEVSLPVSGLPCCASYSDAVSLLVTLALGITKGSSGGCDGFCVIRATLPIVRVVA